MLGIQLLCWDLKLDPIIGLFEQVSGNFSMLSWAVPGQEGLSHINNKPIEYVSKVKLILDQK